MTQETLKKTCLYDAHLNCAAKIVNFGGWAMPVSYGSQIKEHEAVRTSVGMFDVSHMLGIDVIGSQAKKFLRLLLSNDVQKLTVAGKALYSCMLNAQAGIVDDLIVYYFSENHYRVVVNASTADTDLDWMNQVLVAQGFDCDLTPRRDLSMLALQGPLAQEKLAQIRPQWSQQLSTLKPFFSVQVDDGLVARTGYTGEDGFEIALPHIELVKLWEDLVSLGVQPCGLGARDTLRLEAGMNLYGQDMNQEIQPGEAGLSWVVDLKDSQRDFVGCEILRNSPKKSPFLGIKLLERGVIRSHMKVYTSVGEGEVTSGTMSPTMGVSIGFARLPQGCEVGQEVEVEIRGKRVRAEVCKLPFVRHGKVLV